jgi:lysophospholipid acyltransferase (LPLAT)-like uncharacterized protein
MTMPTDDERQRRISRWARLGVLFVRLLGRTWRFQVSHDDAVRQLRANKRPLVFSLWHGEMLPLLYLHRDEGVTVLISEHADGEIIARIAARLGYRTVRGSTSRGATRALLGLVRVLEEGGELAITPDGPRGPSRSFAPGVAIVAHRAGAPVVGVSAVASSGWRLKTWDRFLIPRPFARVRVAYSDALNVEANDTRAAAADSALLRAAMLVAEERAHE